MVTLALTLSQASSVPFQVTVSTTDVTAIGMQIVHSMI